MGCWRWHTCEYIGLAKNKGVNVYGLFTWDVVIKKILNKEYEFKLDTISMQATRRSSVWFLEGNMTLTLIFDKEKRMGAESKLLLCIFTILFKIFLTSEEKRSNGWPSSTLKSLIMQQTR